MDFKPFIIYSPGSLLGAILSFLLQFAYFGPIKNIKEMAGVLPKETFNLSTIWVFQKETFSVVSKHFIL